MERRKSAKLTLGLTALALAGAFAYPRLPELAAWLAYSLLRLPQSSRIGSAVEFLLYETPKVLMLLAAVVFVMGIVRSFFSAERTRAILSGKSELLGGVLAALLGVVTPFCSCSAVPLFIGFVTAGVPLGVTFSFLVSAPMINEVALGLLFALFGWKTAAIYMCAGLLVAIAAGLAIGRLRLEKYVESWVYESGGAAHHAGDEERLRFAERLRCGWDAVKDIVGKVWPYILAGICVGAGIHGYVPESLMASFMGSGAWWAVPLAVVLGVPMYSNAAGIIPIVQALLGKGAALGTALAFMMSVVGLSLPEAVILRKVIKPQLIAVFFGIVALGILAVGYLFNAIM